MQRSPLRSGAEPQPGDTVEAAVLSSRAAHAVGDKSGRKHRLLKKVIREVSLLSEASLEKVLSFVKFTSQEVRAEL